MSISTRGGRSLGRDDPAGRLEAVHRRHADVHQHDVRPAATGRLDGLARRPWPRRRRAGPPRPRGSSGSRPARAPGRRRSGCRCSCRRPLPRAAAGPASANPRRPRTAGRARRLPSYSATRSEMPAAPASRSGHRAVAADLELERVRPVADGDDARGCRGGRRRRRAPLRSPGSRPGRCPASGRSARPRCAARSRGPRRASSRPAPRAGPARAAGASARGSSSLRSIPSRRRRSASASRPVCSTVRIESRARSGSLRSSRRAPPAWMTIALTLWAMMSCSSLPIRTRSCAIAARSRSSCSAAAWAASSRNAVAAAAALPHEATDEPRGGEQQAHEERGPRRLRRTEVRSGPARSTKPPNSAPPRITAARPRRRSSHAPTE